jgi:putative flippase GtrA
MFNILSSKNKLFRKIGRYGVVGATLNLIGLLTFILLTNFGIPANISLLCASVALFPLAYFLSQKYVFKLEVDSRKSRVKFFSTYFLILLINYAALDLLLSTTSISPVNAQISIFLILVVMNYVAQSIWVFKSSQRDVGA